MTKSTAILRFLITLLIALHLTLARILSTETSSKSPSRSLIKAEPSGDVLAKSGYSQHRSCVPQIGQVGHNPVLRELRAREQRVATR